ncbi:MAG: CapA family protein [Lachnospiraceae bacterium]|nr:CapA family protein [Lachnospiraceae bacterium]
MKPFAKGLAAGLAIGVLLLLILALYSFTSGTPEESGQTQDLDPLEAPAEISTPEESPRDTAEEPEELFLEPSEENSGNTMQEEELPEEPQPSEVLFSFAGDVMFSDHYTSAYDQYGISAVADDKMLSAMRDSDLFMLNEEFPFSLQGEAMEDKQYTFRTDPRYVSIFQDLGVDMVSVANNHALDFGMDAFCDTLDTLKQAEISCIGGGYNITEASAPATCEVNGQTFAVFAATRVSPSYDWYATDSQPGMFQTYDPSMLNAAIAEADGQYDHVVVFIHWGIERNEYPEDYQRSLAKGYIDAGADLVLGCHPHILQGFEYYKDVPIVYSLGNYLFGSRDGDTLLLQAVFPDDGAMEIRLLPCRRQNGILSAIEDPSALYRRLTELSFGAEVSPEGILGRTAAD